MSLASPNAVSQAPPYVEVRELGLFGAMALLAMLEAGADPGFRHLRRLAGRGARLAPHDHLRRQIVCALVETGVLVPTAPRRLRLDASLAESAWGPEDIEEADWTVRWGEATRGSLPAVIRAYLDQLPSTERNREVLLDSWIALAKAECLAFGAHALSAHRMDPVISMAAEPALGPILAQRSIGQCCALMWWAAKNVAASFLRHGGQPGLAEREVERTLTNAVDRVSASGGELPTFQRHHTLPASTFTGAFLLASRLGDAYWTCPVTEDALLRARPEPACSLQDSG